MDGLDPFLTELPGDVGGEDDPDAVSLSDLISAGQGLATTWTGALTGVWRRAEERVNDELGLSASRRGEQGEVRSVPTDDEPRRPEIGIPDVPAEIAKAVNTDLVETLVEETGAVAAGEGVHFREKEGTPSSSPKQASSTLVGIKTKGTSGRASSIKGASEGYLRGIASGECSPAVRESRGSKSEDHISVEHGQLDERVTLDAQSSSVHASSTNGQGPLLPNATADFALLLAAREAQVEKLGAELAASISREEELRERLQTDAGLGAADVDAREALLAERDATIAELMEEGEVLSRKQLGLEQHIKKLRKELDGETEKTEILLASLEKSESARQAAECLVETLRAEAADLIEVSGSAEAMASESKRLAVERAEQHQDLALQLAAGEDRERALALALHQAQAEVAALDAASAIREDGLMARVRALDGEVRHLREELECARQLVERQGADSESGRRVSSNSETEVGPGMQSNSVGDLAKQVKALQAAAAVSRSSWAQMERGLQARVAEAERARDEATGAVMSSEEERRAMHAYLATARHDLGVAQGRLISLEASLHDAQRRADDAESAQRATEAKLHEAQSDARIASSRVADLESRADASSASLREAKVRLEAVVDENRTLEKLVAGLEHSLEGSGHDNADVFLRKDRRGARFTSEDVEVLALRASRLEIQCGDLRRELAEARPAVRSLARLESQLAICRADLEQAEARVTYSLEMVGERQEALDDALAELADVKKIYKEHLEALCPSS